MSDSDSLLTPLVCLPQAARGNQSFTCETLRPPPGNRIENSRACVGVAACMVGKIDPPGNPSRGGHARGVFYGAAAKSPQGSFRILENVGPRRWWVKRGGALDRRPVDLSRCGGRVWAALNVSPVKLCAPTLDPPLALPWTLPWTGRWCPMSPAAGSKHMRGRIRSGSRGPPVGPGAGGVGWCRSGGGRRGGGCFAVLCPGRCPVPCLGQGVTPLSRSR